MEDLFVQTIYINQIRNIQHLEIPLHETERKHLLITGKNGSGKTSLLAELKKQLELNCYQTYEKYLDMQQKNSLEISKLIEKELYISQLKKLSNEVLVNPTRKALSEFVLYFKEINSKINKIDGNYELDIETYLKKNLSKDEIISLQNIFLSTENDFIEIQNSISKSIEIINSSFVTFNNHHTLSEEFIKGNFVIVYFEARRGGAVFANPTGIQKLEQVPFRKIDEKVGLDFLQYIVNLKADRSFANDENDKESVQKIDEWFAVFEKALFDLIGNDRMEKLQFDRETYHFNIVEKGKNPYNLNQLSDGYSAIIDIVSELIMRMEFHKTKSYDLQGIVLIDEIETHLHVDLQKKVLPFLIGFFPKIQFIVSTHSPFVLSSIENSVICDLEKRIVTSNMSAYSYDAIIESYFDSDKYSELVKNTISEYEKLMDLTDLNEEETERLDELKAKIAEFPTFKNDELTVKLQQIRLKKLKNKK